MNEEQFKKLVSLLETNNKALEKIQLKLAVNIGAIFGGMISIIITILNAHNSYP